VKSISSAAEVGTSLTKYVKNKWSTTTFNNFEYKMTEAEQLKSLSRVLDPGTDLRVGNELTRGPNEIVQYFRLQSSHRQSAACPKFDMVWQRRLPIPVGEEGGNILVQSISTCLTLRKEGGGRHPVGQNRKDYSRYEFDHCGIWMHVRN
jgi:hypothetical protein